MFLSVYNKILSTPTLNLGERQIISVYLTAVFQSQEEMCNEEQHKSAIRNVEPVTSTEQTAYSQDQGKLAQTLSTGFFVKIRGKKVSLG